MEDAPFVLMRVLDLTPIGLVALGAGLFLFGLLMGRWIARR